MASEPTTPLLTLTINNDLVLFRNVPFRNVHFPRTPADLFIVAVRPSASIPDATWTTLGALWWFQHKTRWQCQLTTEPEIAPVVADGYLVHLLLTHDAISPHIRLIIAGLPRGAAPAESSTL